MNRLTLKPCTICRVALAQNDVCYKCRKKAERAKKLTRRESKARQWAHERAANQETKEDEIAMRLPVQARMEERPCRRCGRLVLVQSIPEEERRKLRTLPEAVECERPCEMRI